MTATDRDIARCVELLLSMTQAQRQEVIARADLCRNCQGTKGECSGWCDYQTPND